MELEGSFPHSQVSNTCPYPEHLCMSLWEAYWLTDVLEAGILIRLNEWYTKWLLLRPVYRWAGEAVKRWVQTCITGTEAQLRDPGEQLAHQTLNPNDTTFVVSCRRPASVN